MMNKAKQNKIKEKIMFTSGHHAQIFLVLKDVEWNISLQDFYKYDVTRLPLIALVVSAYLTLPIVYTSPLQDVSLLVANPLGLCLLPERSGF